MRRGFSLIELMIVLVLIGVITAVASLSLRQGLTLTNAEDAVQALATLDRQCRDEAQRHGHAVVLTIDLDEGVLSRSDPGNLGIPQNAWAVRPGGQETGRGQVALGRGLRVTAVHTGSGPVTTGRVAIRFNQDGGSADYAVTLQGQDTPPLRLMMIGATGQTLKIDDANLLPTYFEAATPRAWDEPD